MFGAIAKAIFGSSNDRYVKSMRPLVAKINALEPQFEAMGDEELQNQTQLLKARLAEGETLDDILPEAFATVREAAKRSEEHTSELQSLMRISYAVFCLKKKNNKHKEL